REAVLVNIVVQPGVNAVAVMRQVEERLAGIRSHFPPGVEMRKWYDLSDFIRNSIAGVYNSIFFGAGLTVLILLLFLRRLRITLVTALIIPVALLITFILIKLFGMDLNLMSLGGLAASIGILVDNAIVVVENIERFLEEGHDRSEAVILATQEIIAPLISATLTTLVVFAPLIFLSGVPGIFFRALAGTLSITVGVSMLLAMFLTPALAAILVSGKRRSAGRFLPRLVAFLHRILRFNFKFPVISGLLILALAGMAVFFYFAIPSGFLPEWDEGTLVLDFKAPPGSSVAGSYAMLATLEEHLAEIPEVADYSLRIGTSLGHPRLHPNEGDFLISLRKDRSRSVFDIMDELRSYAEGAEPRLEIELFQVLPDRLNSDLAGEVAPVVITLFGNNLPVMQESASQIAAALEKIPNVVDVYQGYETSEPELNIRIIPEIAARLGVSVAEVRRAVNMALWGETTTHVVEGLKVIPVQLRYPARDYRHLEEIRRLPVYLPELDRMITLEEVADIRKSPGLTDVENENLSLVVNVSAQLSGRDLGSVMKDVRATLQRMSLPPGITLRIGGASESQRQAFYQLLLILGFGTLMVFAILLFEFKSFKTAAIVMTGTLLSISGVFLLLWITGIPLDISAFMGMIMIIGVVVNNGILVIDYTEYYRRTSPDTAEALLAAVKVRLRPVLMTTLSTIIGFLPLALALGEGGEMLQPLAVSMIGGMSFSLLLSLVVIPVLYYTAHRGKEIINTP
ncbi:MAG TPA: efflux RND transporter permease subunit, partial [Calditrichia bacterium]|nr:efflux RND transporter permease subunit [Calditrichia bacterium]